MESRFNPEASKPKGKEFNVKGQSQMVKPSVRKKELSYNDMTDTQLTAAMENAVENENYEEAAKIKAEIDKRAQQNHSS